MSTPMDSEMERYEEILEEFTDSGDSKRVTALVDPETNEQAVIPGDVDIVSSPPPGSYVRVLICQECSTDELTVQHISPTGVTYDETVPEQNTFAHVFEVAGEMAAENACPLLDTVQRESTV